MFIELHGLIERRAINITVAALRETDDELISRVLIDS